MLCVITPWLKMPFRYSTSKEPRIYGKTRGQTKFCSLQCSRESFFSSSSKKKRTFNAVGIILSLSYLFSTHTVACKFTLRHFVEKFYVTTVYIFPMACQKLSSFTVKLLTEKILKWESFSNLPSRTLDKASSALSVWSLSVAGTLSRIFGE